MPLSGGLGRDAMEKTTSQDCRAHGFGPVRSTVPTRNLERRSGIGEGFNSSAGPGEHPEEMGFNSMHQ